MSWLQDLAGRAENILNKIDQNAANVLQSSNSATSNKPIDDSQFTPTISVIESSADHRPPASVTSSLIPKSFSSQSLQLLGQRSSGLPNPSPKHPKRALSLRSPSPAASETAQSQLSEVDDQARKTIPAETTILLDPADSPQSTPKSSAISSSSNSVANDETASEAEPEESIAFVAPPAFVQHLDTANADLLQRNDELLLENVQLQRSVEELRSQLVAAKSGQVQLKERLDWLETQSAQAVHELQQYRVRAQASLQLKDRLIADLQQKASSNSESAPLTGAAESAESTTNQQDPQKLQLVQRECLALTQKCEQLTDQLRQTRQLVGQLEEADRRQQDDWSATRSALSAELAAKEQRCATLEADARTVGRELRAVREEMQRQQTDLMGKGHAKDTELRQLRQQLAATQTAARSAAVGADFEDRIQSLTQSLVQKQTALESRTGERNALRLQLEKMEQLHRDALQQWRDQQQHSATGAGRSGRGQFAISVNDTDDAKARLPQFMQETPFDTRVARRVKRVYSSLDAVGVQVGLVLRRYPLVRICSVFYVVLLHLWVMVVLCTSAPTN